MELAKFLQPCNTELSLGAQDWIGVRGGLRCARRRVRSDGARLRRRRDRGLDAGIEGGCDLRLGDHYDVNFALLMSRCEQGRAFEHARATRVEIQCSKHNQL